jgi:hypothetical protein
LELALHRVQVDTQPPRPGHLLRADTRVGEVVGRVSQRWRFAPHDFVALPGREPAPTAFDATRPQRFVMLDGDWTFGAGDDGFRGFGTGRTEPAAQGRVDVLAVGTVLEGRGRFRDHEAGTYVLCGSLHAESGFMGSAMLRVLDLQGALRTGRSLPPLRSRPAPEPGVTYVVLRGEAVPADPVRPYLGPDGRPRGLVVQQGLRLHHLDCALRPDGLATSDRVGRVVGRITAYVTFDPSSASGASLDPIPFVTYDEMELWDADGAGLGRFVADSSEGRVFNLQISGRQAIRFGGVGRLRGGDGELRELSGLMSDNSIVVFDPHVSASVYVLRIDDPEGRFAAAL